MIPSIFPHVAADPGVQAALGPGHVRFVPFGEAPEGLQTPYATWQGVGGSPENHLNCRPDIDRFALQIDVWADGASSAGAVAAALRDAIEGRAHIMGWRTMGRDSETKRYRISFDVDWWEYR